MINDQNDNNMNDTLFKLTDYSQLPEWDEYEIYHDESKANKLIHGYLLVPVRVKANLLEALRLIREKYNCDSKLHYFDLSGKKENIKHKSVRDLIYLMTEAFKSKRHDKQLWGVCPPRCKFGIFIKKNINRMNSKYFAGTENPSRSEIDIRKIETLLRIGLKGVLHNLFDENSKIKISGFYTDGLSWVRGFDKERVLERLYKEKRTYIDFDNTLDIKPIFTNHKDKRCLDYDRAQLLQICDCLLGAFIYSIAECDQETVKAKIAKPIKEIMRKAEIRKSNFKHSSHYRAFSATQAHLIENEWCYEHLEVSKYIDKMQLKLFE